MHYASPLYGIHGLSRATCITKRDGQDSFDDCLLATELFILCTTTDNHTTVNLACERHKFTDAKLFHKLPS